MRIAILLLLANVAIGQTFITTIHIENAFGETDSVQIGYDPDATVQIDTQFGEVDISELQFSSNLDVRVGQIDAQMLDCDDNDVNVTPGLMRHNSKIDITPENCNGWENFIPFSTLFIKDKNYPITITWTSEDFQTECLNASLITDWYPGGWFDATCHEIAVPPTTLSHKQEAVINFQSETYIIDQFQDTLFIFYIPLWPDEFMGVDDNADQLDVSIYPNPTTGKVWIDHIRLQEIKVYNNSGKLLQMESETIDLTDQSDGIYIIYMTDLDGNTSTRKVINN